MRKISTFLQYPWKFPDSSYYKNMLEFPPKMVEFVNYKKQKKKIDIISSSKKFEKIRVFKNFIRKILNVSKIPNLTFSFRNNESDLIHCAHCLSLNRSSWVVDTETYERLSASGGNVTDKGVGKWIIKKRLESKYCKKIICWSEDCKKSIIDAFPKNRKILDKLEIVPFALSMPKFRKIRHRNLRILFIARWFDAKGGRQTLEVFDRLSKKHKDVEFWFICPTSKNLVERYSGNKQIKILDLMSQERLFKEIYPVCDIFFYPGFGDSYGFAVPEAMSFGLPIVTANTFAKKEIVGKAGFLIDLPKDWKGYGDMNESFIGELVKKTEILIKNKKLREKMGRVALREAKEKFSIEKRNRKLRKIYEEALDS